MGTLISACAAGNVHFLARWHVTAVVWARTACTEVHRLQNLLRDRLRERGDYLSSGEGALFIRERML